jgi:hypothetical protein
LSDDANDPLRLFMLEQVSSYEELEALLFLAQHEGRELTDAELAAALRAPVGAIEEALRGLARRGELVEVTQRSGVALYRYAPRDDAGRARVEELRHAYAERRLSVVRMMSSNAVERVRAAAMQRLADAFRIERGKK